MRNYVFNIIGASCGSKLECFCYAQLSLKIIGALCSSKLECLCIFSSGTKSTFRAEEGPEQHLAADDGREPEVRGTIAASERDHEKSGRFGKTTLKFS